MHKTRAYRWYSCGITCFAASILAITTANAAPPTQNLSAQNLPAQIPSAQGWSTSEPPFSASYADLVDLADSARIVAHVKVTSIARIKDTLAPGLVYGYGRFYIKAQTQALLWGEQALDRDIVFLADLPLDVRGKPFKLARKQALIFASPVRDKPNELVLAAPDALLLWNPVLDAQARTILTDLVAKDAPPRILGVREIMNTPGALAGQSNTQIFLETADHSAASIAVEHTPGSNMQWGVSFTELTASANTSPKRDTLSWYRLACFLAPTLPRGANLSETPQAEARARMDYEAVLKNLGPCMRERNPVFRKP